MCLQNSAQTFPSKTKLTLQDGGYYSQKKKEKKLEVIDFPLDDVILDNIMSVNSQKNYYSSILYSTGH